MARTKVLPIYLPADAYANLERLARSQEREPVQQARWIIKQALDERTTDRLTTSPRGEGATA